MGFDGIYNVYRKVNDSYEKLAFYDKNGKELHDAFPSRDGMLNQMLLGMNRHGYDFEPIGDHRGVPQWYVDKLKEEHPDWFDTDDKYGWVYNPNEGTYYDYLELKAWSTSPVQEHVDYYIMDDDEEIDTDSPRPRRNPLKEFVAQINMYLHAYDIYYPKPGDVIIVCEASY